MADIFGNGTGYPDCFGGVIMADGDVLGKALQNQQDTNVQLSAPLGDVITYLYLLPLPSEIKITQIVTKTRAINNSFVLGHTVNGKLGTQSPQPLLGDYRSAWTTVTTDVY